MFECLLPRQQTRLAKAIFTGEKLIQFQTKTIEWRFPPVVVGHDKSEVTHQMWRVLKQKATLFEGLHHQPNIALLQITHAAMCQLGAAAGSAFAEVPLLKQQHVIA